jgi:c-di-GMP-binding flagellar brake protein YcgR
MPTEPLPTQGSERYLVRHTHEIERILRSVMESKSLVTLYNTKGRDFILSSIVALDPREGSLQVEQGSSRILNDRLLESGHATCVTTLDQVHIQFTAQDIQPARLGEEPVFRFPIPRELLRLQRREYYRLATSVLNPVKCLVNTGGTFLEAVVIDISIGGVGILAYEGAGLLRAGQTYHGCRIDLPGAGTFAVSLNVCTTFDVELKNGRLTHRAGCQFIDLPLSVETEIQRYIIRVERERRARYT